MKKEKIKIVIIGDSNTEGFGLADKKLCYPHKLGKALGDRYIVHNMGVSGSCVINATLNGKIMGMPYVKLHRYKQALSITGDMFIINLGTNDAQDGMHDFLPEKDIYNDLITQSDRFYDDYMKIINDIKSQYLQAKIIICIPVPIRACIWRKHQQKYLDMLIPDIFRISQENKDILLLDLKSAFMELKKTEIDSMYLNDRLHLNEKGTTYVCSKMTSFIKEIYEKRN